MSEKPIVRHSAPTETAALRSVNDGVATGRRRRRVPPWSVWAPVALLVLAIVLLRGFADVDPAARNIATFVLGVVASATLLVWWRVSTTASWMCCFW